MEQPALSLPSPQHDPRVGIELTQQQEDQHHLLSHPGLQRRQNGAGRGTGLVEEATPPAWGWNLLPRTCLALDFSLTVIGFPAPQRGLWRGGLQSWDRSPMVLLPGTTTSITGVKLAAVCPQETFCCFSPLNSLLQCHFPATARCWVPL